MPTKLITRLDDRNLHGNLRGSNIDYIVPEYFSDYVFFNRVLFPYMCTQIMKRILTS